MVASVATPAKFDIGRVVSRAFGVAGRNLATFLVLAVLLVGVPTTALFAATVYAPGLQAVGVPTSLGIVAGIVSALVVACATTVLQGAVMHGAVSDLSGQPVGVADCLRTGLRFILPLIGLGIVSGIGIGAATILLIVPGVLLALAWSVAAPAEVIERQGVMGSLDRSVVLTRNHRGAIFGLAVIYFVVVYALQFGAAAVGLAIGLGTQNLGSVIIRGAANMVSQTLIALLGSVGVASVYYELRQIKDGVGAQQLAAIFD